MGPSNITTSSLPRLTIPSFKFKLTLTMHHCTKRYTELSPKRVARLRTLELARYGYTNLPVPETIEPKTSYPLFHTVRSNRTREFVFATLLLVKALNREKETRETMEFRINHHSRMAQQRLWREDAVGACISMRRVINDHSEYLYIVRRIAAINTLRYNLEHGLIAGKHVTSNLKEIMSTPRSRDKLRASTSEEIMEELERCNFFPVLDIHTGKISFTGNFEEISKLNDHSDLCVEKRTSTPTPRFSKKDSETSFLSSNFSFDSDE